MTDEAWQETRRLRGEKVAGDASETAENRLRVVPGKKDDEEERERAGDRVEETWEAIAATIVVIELLMTLLQWHSALPYCGRGDTCYWTSIRPIFICWALGRYLFLLPKKIVFALFLRIINKIILFNNFVLFRTKPLGGQKNLTKIYFKPFGWRFLQTQLFGSVRFSFKPNWKTDVIL